MAAATTAAAKVFIYFWGLFAVVQGPGDSSKTSADVVLVDISKSQVPAVSAHPHFPQLVVNMKFVNWDADEIAKERARYPERLLPVGGEIFGVWDLKGVDVSIEGSPDLTSEATYGALRIFENEKIRFKLGIGVVVEFPHPENRMFFASPRLLASPDTLDPNLPFVERKTLRGPDRRPIVSSRIRLSDGAVGALHVEGEEEWEYATGAFDGAGVHAHAAGAGPSKVLLRKVSAPAARYERDHDKVTRLCLGPCGARRSMVTLSAKEGVSELVATISNYPALDDSHASGALHHFAAYYDLLPNPPSLAERVVPFKPARKAGHSGEDAFLKTVLPGISGNDLLAARAAIRAFFLPEHPQNPPDCQGVFLLSK